MSCKTVQLFLNKVLIFFFSFSVCCLHHHCSYTVSPSWLSDFELPNCFAWLVSLFLSGKNATMCKHHLHFPGRLREVKDRAQQLQNQQAVHSGSDPRGLPACPPVYGGLNDWFICLCAPLLPNPRSQCWKRVHFVISQLTRALDSLVGLQIQPFALK